MVNGQKKLSRRNLLFLLLALLLLAVLIYSLFPKTTVASILHLDSKDQIVKIEIGKSMISNNDSFFSETKREWLDITGSPLGERYANAFFAHPIEPVKGPTALYMGNNKYEYETVAIRFTLSELPEDYPFKENEHTLLIGAPIKEKETSTYLHLHYTLDEQMRLQEKLNAEGKGEIAPTQEYHEFDLSHNELFTPDFINKQFE